MMKRAGILALLFTLSAAISAAEGIHYVITGRLDNPGAEGGRIVIYDYDRRTNINSAVVKNGCFRIEGDYGRRAYVRVESGREYANCILDDCVTVDFSLHTAVDGSATTREYIRCWNELEALRAESDEYSRALKARKIGDDEFRDKMGAFFRDRFRPRFLQIVADAAENRADGLAEWGIMELGEISLTLEEWEAVCDRLAPEIRNSRMVRHKNDVFENIRRTSPGSPFVDFECRTLDGRAARLSDIVGRGRYVLVDFWASWCVPCRQEAAEVLKPLYEKYENDPRLVILGVNIWDDDARAVETIETSEYRWSHLIAADKTAMKVYGFEGIPQLLLFDPEGRILARNIRGAAVSAAVDKALAAVK